MDLFEEDAAPANTPEFSVSELSGAVKKAVESGFGHVRVRGEVGRVSRPASGHLYLDLKDDRAVLASVIWKGQAAKLAHRPEEGMEVIATGRLTTFPGQSRYQMVIEDIQPAGAGALMAMLEKRRKALAAEGLFDAERKRTLPFLPGIIGVVTSPSGAVIRDILHRVRDRFPSKVLVWPAAVQGQKCAAEVVAGIEGFNAMTRGGALPRPDVIIVARGGGSLEDLWGFNEEAVVRAAASSEIPLISAVGHETDTTLIDFASDMRAPTPTAAAELAVPVRLELMAGVESLSGRLMRALAGAVDGRKQRLRDMARALPRAEALVEGPRQRLDAAAARLPGALRAATAVKREALAKLVVSPAVIRRTVADDRRRLTEWSDRLGPALGRAVERKRDALARQRLPVAGLKGQVRDQRLRYEARAERLTPDLMRARLQALGERLAAVDRLRETLGYEATLQRGFAVVRGDGALVTDVAGAKAATALEIQFADGRLEVGGKAVKPKKAKDMPPEQGSLL